jgi:hypothetical protein
MSSLLRTRMVTVSFSTLCLDLTLRRCETGCYSSKDGYSENGGRMS